MLIHFLGKSLLYPVNMKLQPVILAWPMMKSLFSQNFAAPKQDLELDAIYLWRLPRTWSINMYLIQMHPIHHFWWMTRPDHFLNKRPNRSRSKSSNRLCPSCPVMVKADLHCSDEGASNPVKAPLVDRLLLLLHPVHAVLLWFYTLVWLLKRARCCFPESTLTNLQRTVESLFFCNETLKDGKGRIKRAINVSEYNMSLHSRDRNRAGLAYCLNLVIAELYGQVFHLRGNEKAPVGTDPRLGGRHA